MRVYHDDLQRDYPAVWDDDTLLANWLRLLVVGDKLWPAPGEVPASVRPRVLMALESTGILEALPKHRFALRGLNSERARRAASARVGAGVRWDSERNANGVQPQSEGESDRNASQVRGERVRASALGVDSESTTEEDSVLAWLASVGATVQPNGNGHHRDLVLLVGRQGADAVLTAMRRRYEAGDRSKAQLIYGAANDLEPIHRPGSKAKTKGATGNEEEGIRAFKSA